MAVGYCAVEWSGQASTLREIEERSILIDGDIAAVIEEMKKTASYK